MIAEDRDPFSGRDQRSATGNEIGLFIPVADVFPGTTADVHTLVRWLDTLRRDDTLFHAAHLNIIMSGCDVRPRQEQAMQMLCTPEQFDRINAFTRSNKAVGLPSVFCPAQVLELMRWTAVNSNRCPFARVRRAAAIAAIDQLDLLAPVVWRYAGWRRRPLRFGLAPACADPRGMKRLQRVAGTEVRL